MKPSLPSSEGIPPLPTETGQFTRPLKICFSIPEFLGFPNRGGIGQTYAAFAEALAEAGHEVTVLIAADLTPDDPRMLSLEEQAKAMGVRLVFLPELPFRCVAVPTTGGHPVIAYRAWYWLKDRNFDVIHFTEYQTSGFFCVSAKRAGMGFQNTLLCVSLRSPSRWCREGDGMLISKFAMLETDFLEQRTAELADLVFVPSRSIAKWALGRGWNLPARLYHQPNLIRLPHSFAPPTIAAPDPVREIVFFGRLQLRKGLLEFCEAIDQLDPALLSKVSITFLGSHVGPPFDSKAFLMEKMGGSAGTVRVLDQHSREEALHYLRRPGVLAVIPSRVETFGNAVYECLVLGIPFLAANTTAIPELIRPQDHGRVLFELSAKALAKKLTAALLAPPQAVLPQYLPSTSERLWVGWHNELASHRSDVVRMPPPEALPRVSVCLVHFNQPTLLLKAIESLEAQTYPNFEVILVDDGSTQAAAQAVLMEIEQCFAVRGWRVLRQENRYVGAARNHAAREATGEFLMFMDDDNIAKPGEIACFVQAALASGQDVVVSTMDCFEGLGDPLPMEDPGQWRQIFLGGPLSTAIFQNTLGDANFFIRRAVFEALGGFPEVMKITGEDRYFLARAVLAGHRILMLPEALYYYRRRPDSMYRSLKAPEHEKLVMTVFDDVVPSAIKDSLVYGFSLHKKNNSPSSAPRVLRDYRTVIDSSAAAMGVEMYWGSGWFEDESDQIWSGGESPSATLLLNAKSPCHVDFRAQVVAADPGNSLCVAFNGEVLESRVEGRSLHLEDLLLQEGANELRFTPRLPPARVIPGEQRKLSYLFNEISITPSAAYHPGRIASDVLTPAENTDRTVLINELFRIGARAVFDKGWYSDEIVRRWAGRTGRISSIIFESPLRRNIHFSAEVYWLSRENSLSVQSHRKKIPFKHCKRFELSIPLEPDLRIPLVFETNLPPAVASSEYPRLLSFCLSNIRIAIRD